MKPEIDLQSLQQHLTMNVTPQELSEVLDDLLFDYIRLLLYSASQLKDEKEAYLHVKTHDFIHHLRELRDLLRLC